MLLDIGFVSVVTRGSITLAQDQGAFQVPLLYGLLSPMKVEAIDPESSNVTTMFGSTDWVRSGGVGPRSGGSFGAVGATAAAMLIAPAHANTATSEARLRMRRLLKCRMNMTAALSWMGLPPQNKLQ